MQLLMAHPSAAGFHHSLCCCSQSSLPLPLELLKLKPLPTLNKAEYYSRSYLEIETSIPFPSLLPGLRKVQPSRLGLLCQYFGSAFSFIFINWPRIFTHYFLWVFQWKNIFQSICLEMSFSYLSKQYNFQPICLGQTSKHHSRFLFSSYLTSKPSVSPVGSSYSLSSPHLHCHIPQLLSGLLQQLPDESHYCSFSIATSVIF